MFDGQIYKRTWQKASVDGWAGLVWEEQSPIDKLFFKSGRAGLTNSGNITFSALKSLFLYHYI